MGQQQQISHLAQWDNGRDTEAAAETYGHIYSEAPMGEHDSAVVCGDYVMTYDVNFSYIGLVRMTAAPSTAAVGADLVLPHRSHERRRQDRTDGRPWRAIAVDPAGA